MARKLSDCCNPSAKRDEDRCIGCPMRTSVVPQAATDKEAKPPPKAEAQPAARARPEPRKSLWAFLNGDIPRE